MVSDANRRRGAPGELAGALHAAAIHLLRRLRRSDPRSGLSPARLSALSVIAFGGPMRISALARAEQVRTPTMTPIVVALEQQGLITREADAHDARVSILRATPRGRKLMAEGRARRVAALTRALRRQPPADRDVLRRGVGLIEQLARDVDG